MKIKTLILSVLALSLVKPSEPKSLQAPECDLSCSTDGGYFRFNAGDSMIYMYEAIVTNSFQEDARSRNSEVTLKAQVQIDVISSCQQTMQIRSASITSAESPTNVESWEEKLLANKVSFTYQPNGSLGKLCGDKNEPTWVTNIKRGILSTLSVVKLDNDQTEFVEVDVFGRCLATKYEEETDQSIKTISYEKDLSKCQSLNRPVGSLFSTVASGTSQTALEQVQKCEQKVQYNRVVSTSCLEKHVLRPFSNENDGATTTVKQSLEFSYSSSVRATASNEEQVQYSLEFEEEQDTPQEREIEAVLSLYSKVCSTLDTETFEEVSQDFVDLVFLLRKLDSSAITQAYSALNGACTKYESSLRSMFIDALKWCGSEGCVTYGAKLIAEGSDLLDEETSLQWLSTMNMVKNPTASMVEAMLEVVKSGRFENQAYLVTGSLINGLCSLDNRCFDHYAVRNALKFFENKTGTNCYSPNTEVQNQVMLALKAIGNAGKAYNYDVLLQCAKESRNSAEVRVAAMQAFRRVSCGVNRELESLVLDVDEDSEIRINAYISKMKCPTNEFISKIVRLLDEEPSHQVASFISTHLRALVSSTDPLKGYIKPYLVEAEFAKVHNMDPRKFSWYHELSYFSDELNVGGTGEASLIWSKNSFVPRSAAFNFSANVFGKPMELFEVGGRVQGLEKLIEEAMQTNKFLRDVGVLENLGRDFDDEEEEEQKPPSRKKPKYPNIDRMNEIRNEFAEIVKKDVFSASYYMRVFGDEINYDISQPNSVKKSLTEQISIFFQTITEGSEFNYHKNMAFATWAYTVPTSAGLPLTIAVNGSTSLDVRMTGQMDFSGLLSATPHFSLNTETNPRATVVVNAAMTVDFVATKTGIMTQSSMVSDWKMNGKASMESGAKLNIRIDAPYKEQTFFKFNHKLMTIHGHLKQPLTTGSGSSYEQCSDEIGGHMLCFTAPTGKISIFPKDGELSYGVVVRKNDDGLNYFQLTANYAIENAPSGSFQNANVDFTFDTPGSYTSRRSTISVIINNDDVKSGSISWQKPEDAQQSQVSASFTNNGKDMSIAATYRDSTGSQNIISGNYMNNLKSRNPHISCNAEITTPSRSYEFNNDLSYLPMKKVQFSSSLTDYYNVDFKFADESTSSKMIYTGNSELEITGFYDNGVDYKLIVKPQYQDFMTSLEYTFKGERKEMIKVVHTHTDVSKASLTQWTSEDKFILTAFPEYNFAVVLQYLNDEENLNSNAKFSWGSNSLNQRNCRKCVTIDQKYSLSNTKEDTTNVFGSLEIKIPIMSVAESLGFDFSHSTEKIAFSLNYQGDETFRIDLASREEGQEVNVMSPTRWGNLKLKGEIKEKYPMHYVMEGTFSFGDTEDFTMTTVVEIANQNRRKLFSVKVDSARSNMLNLKTDTNMTDTGFKTENLFVSQKFPAFLFNLSHEKKIAKPDFITNFHFEFDPYKLVVNVNGFVSEKNIITEVTFRTKADEKDQTLKTNFNYVDQPRSRETMRYSGNLEVELNIQNFPINSLSLSGGFHRTFSGENIIKCELEKNKEILVGLSVLVSLTPSFNFNVNFKQQIDPLFETVTLNLLVDPHDKNGNFDFSMDGNKMLELEAKLQTNSIKITSFQKLANSVPRDIEVKIQFTDELVVEGEVDGESITFTGKIIERKQILLTLDHSVSKFRTYSVPNSVEFDAQWGLRTIDRKSGLWSTLTLNKIESTFELMYAVERGNKHIVEMDFSPSNNLFMKHLIPLNAKFVFTMLEDGSITFTDQYKLNNEVRANHMFTYQKGLLTFTGRQTIFEELLPSIPTAINLKINWKSEYEIVFGLTKDDEESKVSAKLIYSSLLEMMAQCNMEINLPFLSGIYNASFRIQPDKLNAEVSIDKKLGRLSLTWDYRGGEYEMTMTQDFYTEPEMPTIVKLAVFGDRIGRIVNINAQYNEMSLKYEHELTFREFYLSYNGKVEQSNICDSFEKLNFVTVYKSNFIPSSSSNSLSITAIIDDHEPHKLSVKFLKKIGFYDYTMSMDQDSSLLYPIWYIPQKVDIAVAFSTDQVSVKYTSKNAGLGPISFETIYQKTDRGFNFDTDINDSGIALIFGWAQFKTNLNLKLEGNSLTIDGGYSTDDEINYKAFLMVIFTQTPTYKLITDFKTNIFELLNTGTEFPYRIQTNTTFPFSYGQENSIEIDTKIIRYFKQRYGSETSKENKAKLFALFTLLQSKFEVGFDHDFEIAAVPKAMKATVSYSSSPSSSNNVYKALNFNFNVDKRMNKLEFQYNYNPREKQLYVHFVQDVSIVMYYGVPNDATFTFKEGKNPWDFDIKLSYDTQEKSVGFKFDYQSKDNSLDAYIKHNFNMLETYGIPKKMFIKTQLHFESTEISIDVDTGFGDSIHNAEVSISWKGDNYLELKELKYKHNQDFFSNSFISQNLRITLEVHQDHYGGNFKIESDDKELFNIELKLEINEYEYDFDSKLDQQIFNMIPSSQSLEFQFGFEEDENVVITYKKGNKKLVFDGELKLLENGYTVKFSTKNTIKELRKAGFPRKFNTITTINLDEQTLKTEGEIVRKNKEENTFQFDTGLTTEGFFANFNHDMQDFIVPKQSNMNANFVKEYGQFDLSLQTDVNNNNKHTARVSISYGVHPENFYYKMDFTHDYDMIDLDQNLGIAFGGQISKSEAEIGFNVTTSNNFFNHYCKVDYKYTDEQLAYGILLIQNNYHLSQLGVPESAQFGFDSKWEQGRGYIEGAIGYSSGPHLVKSKTKLSADCNYHDYRMVVINNINLLSLVRTDNFALRANYNDMQPALQVVLGIQEWKQAGLPQNIAFELSNNNDDIFDWSLHATADEEKASLRLLGDYGTYDVTRILTGLTFEHNIKQIINIVPNNVSVNFEGKFESWLVWSTSVGGKYGSKYLNVFIKENNVATEGTSNYNLETNIIDPKIKSWNHKCSWSFINNEFSINGIEKRDNVDWYKYSFGLNTKANIVTLTFNLDDEMDFDFVFDSEKLTTPSKQTVVPLTATYKDSNDEHYSVYIKVYNEAYGSQYGISYYDSHVNIDARGHYVNKNFGVMLTSENCEWTPEKLNLQITTAPYHMISYLKYRGIELLNTDITLETNGKINFKVSDLNGDLISSLNGEYKMANTDFTLNIPYFYIDHSLKTDYNFINGKITFTADLNSRINTEVNANLDFYILLHSNDWSDIKSELNIRSNFEFFNENIKIDFLSSKEQQSGVQTVTVTSFGFGKKSDALLKLGVEIFEFQFNIGSETYGASTSHKRGHESVSRTGSIRWGGPEDKVDFNIEWSNINLKHTVSLIIDQPSKTLGFSYIDLKSTTDLSTPRLTTDLVGNIDGYGGQVNAAYEGNYETLFGTHKGEIQVNYRLNGVRSSTHSANAMVTILDKTINSEFEVKSTGATLLKVSEEFTYGSDSYDATLSVKQAIFSSLNLEFFEVSNSLTFGETTTNSGSLQFNNNPITKYLGSFTNKPTELGFNYELDLSLTTGGLAPYLCFRTLNINGMQKQIGILPSFSWTVELDNNEYHVSLKNTQVSNPRSSSRINSEASLRHPHELSIFGMQLPKKNDFNSLYFTTRKGIKITLNYKNELLANPIIITNSLVLKQDRLSVFEGKLSIDFSQKDSENFGVQYSLTKDRNDYEYSAVISVTSPKFKSPFNLKVSTINSPEEGEKGIDIKFNWVQVNNESYECRVTYDALSIWRFGLKVPGKEKVNYSGNLGTIFTQVISYLGQIYQDNKSDEEIVYFISGTESIENGVDMFFGLGNVFGKEYTLHLVAEKIETFLSLSLKVRENMKKSTDIGEIKMSLIRGQLVKLSMKANPAIGSMVNSIAGIINSKLQNNIDYLTDNILSLCETLTDLISKSHFASDKFNQVVRYITDDIKSARSKTSRFVTDITIGLTSTVSEEEGDLQNKIKSGIVMLLEKLNELNNQFLAPVQQIIDNQRTEFVSDMQASVVESLQFTRPVFDIFNAADLFFALVEEVVEKSLSYLDADISAFILKMGGSVKDLVVVNQNEVVISLPLAFKVDTFSLSEIPTVEDMKEWFTQTALSRKIDELITVAYGYMDTFYVARAVYYTPLSEQRPPFKGHAIVADFKHYRTFDGKYFDFISNCESSHILATDPNDFTVTLTYGDEPTYGVMVGNEWISIGTDGSVSYNKKSVDLPYNKYVNDLTAVRHSNLIVVKHTDKIEVTFDISTKLFVLNINPFYFANVGGLLGTFNNEPNYDFTGPSGTRVQDVSTFAYKWEISDVKCSHANAYASVRDDDSATEICKEYFKEESSIARPCFPVVSVEDFYSACMKDKADFCKIAKAYYTTCTLYGALVSLPPKCIECNAVKGSGISGEEEKEYNTQGVDVVFIMQEAQCIKDKAKVLGKFVKKFIKGAGSTFKKNLNLKNTNYFLVGYGGAIEQPHTYTLKGGKISSSKKSDIVKRIKKITPVSSQEAGDDGMSAVMYAASSLPFRGGAHQVLIHITCDSCNLNSAISLAEVNAFLGERGITYHHMPMNSIATTSRNNKVYGYTATKSFMKNNREVDRTTIIENTDDLCVQVAMENTGAVWNGNNMKSSDFAKIVISKVSNNVSTSTSKTCTCQLNGYGQAVSKCVSV